MTAQANIPVNATRDEHLTALEMLVEDTSAVVIAQLAYWVRTKDGRQRQALHAWLTRLVDALLGRIHGFNVSVAHVWAEQERILDKAGQPMPVEDSYIAATARRHGLTIVTGNGTSGVPGLRSSILSKS